MYAKHHVKCLGRVEVSKIGAEILLGFDSKSNKQKL